MNRLQKFVEQGAFGQRAGRTAYAFNASILPEPGKGLKLRHCSTLLALRFCANRRHHAVLIFRGWRQTGGAAQATPALTNR
jgi:hypothetical protein